ncbi:MAG: 50S ribosomal protein L6 [Candidatus Levybacteria bacterium]|nr:50S ribosomal protein L6 [Candidatus Levybacteria bacterium]MBI2420839.1 50S ribosomal protein L6 [Candidatus Levybacteria bacterium]
MSKIAKKPIDIKEGSSVEIVNNELKVTGPKGNLTFRLPNGVEIKVENNQMQVLTKGTAENLNALSGLARSIAANMIKGVTDGFEKKLELSGVGYRAQASGNTINLSLGFSHPVKFVADPEINFTVEENVITISGIDKALVGNTAAMIRDIRPPEPYKGKGIKYQGERIRRKVGKAAKAVGAK